MVRRNQIDRTIEKIIPFNIVKALAEKTPDNDVLLQPLDQVIILPKVSKEFLSKYRRVKYLSDALVDSRGGLNQELQDSIEDFVSGEAEEHIVFVTSDLSKIRESNFEFPEGKKDDDHEENPFTTRINLANKFEILRYLQDKKLFLNERRSLLQPIVQELQDQNSNGEMSQLVEILGAVADPGVYPILDPSGLDNLVTLAGGLLEGGNFGQMELVRTTFNKGNVLKRIIKLDVSDLGDREILKIENGDVFRIGYATNWRPPEKVEVSGEVMNPGVYQLKIGERLSSVLERAGGVNGNGDLEGLVYNSTKALAKQRLQMKALLDASSRGKAYEPQHVVGSDPESPTQIKPVIVEFHESILDNLSGRVVVDVQSMLEGNRGADPILSDGDRVFVPTSSSEVLVTGEVYQPGNYSYQEGSFIFDYLKDAGGPTELANAGGTFAILPNGSVLKLGKSRFRKRIFEFDSAGSSIPAGSVVVVPPKYYHERTLDKWAVISRVASQSLTSLALPFAIIKSSSDD